MKKFNKTLSILLSLALLFSAFSVTAVADDLASDNVSQDFVGVGDMSDIYKDNLTWTIENGTLTISGTGNMKEYDMLGYTPWYSQRDSIENIVVTNGVTSIGAYAFYGLNNAKSVSLTDSIEYIGDNAFAFCSQLTDITIPSKVTTIRFQTFYFCSSLKNVVLSDATEYIGDTTFYMCESLENITIPESVTFIGENVFGSCFSLKSITGKKGSYAEEYAIANGINFVEPSEKKPPYNCAENKSYTINGKFLAEREDDGKMLTDGFIPEVETSGQTVSVIGTNATSIITVDLGNVYTDISKVILGGIVINGNRQNGIVSIELSTDGVNFFAPYGYEDCLESVSGNTYNNVYYMLKDESARFVKITIINHNYVFTVGDIQVFASTYEGEESSDASSEDSSEIPSEDSSIPSEDSSEIPSDDSFEMPSGEYFIDEEASTMPNVTEKTEATEIISALQECGITATITNKDGIALEAVDNVGTGCKVSTEDGKEYTVIVSGDIDGTGIIDTADYLQVKKAFLGDLSLNGVYFTAADIDGSETLTTTDYLRIKGYFLGTADLYA